LGDEKTECVILEDEQFVIVGRTEYDLNSDECQKFTSINQYEREHKDQMFDAISLWM
jgi:hypothetical protein